MDKSYKQLEHRFHRIGLLREAVSMLQWDQSVVMPLGGAKARGAQIAELNVVIHELITDSCVGSLLEDLDISCLGKWQAANVKEMYRIWSYANAVPSPLIAAYSKACAKCEEAWRQARSSNSYKLVLPAFNDVVDLTREVAEAVASTLNVSVYGALLSKYAPDISVEEVELLFNDYLAFFPNFLERVIAHQARSLTKLELEGPFELEAQRRVSGQLAKAVGIDFSNARLDESAHPFSGGVPEDIRITTRYSEENFVTAIMAVLHEAGHAMYERGRPSRWRYQPVGCSRGMVIHESQSLIIEMQACRSKEFFEWVAPVFARAFNGRGPAWDAENFYKRATSVIPSLVRVDADEVTYPAHIILRTQLERSLLAKDLIPADLPCAWNEEIHKLLGVAPSNDTEGCLQDIHWYDGAWGYFPTYTLGAMAAAQMFQTALCANNNILKSISHGQFRPLMTWLSENIHKHGCLFSTQDLMVRATGRKLNSKAFKKHLCQRYLS